MFPSSLRRLRVFLSVVDAGSFGAAAEQLGITQPSVSGHIRALEQRIGQRLFERRRGASAGLTEKGRRLYERGVDLFERLDQMTAELGLNEPPASKKIVVSAQRFIANYLLSRPIVEFARDHRDIQLTVDVGMYEDVMRDLLSGAADIGFFLSRGPVVDLPSELVGRERLGLFVAPSHPLAGRRRVRPDEVAKHPFVSAHKGSRFSKMIDGALGAIGIAKYPIACQTQEFAMVRELAAVGLGITCSLTRSVTEDVKTGVLAEISLAAPPVFVEVRQAFSARRRPSLQTLTFAGHLKAQRAFA
jgi:LysR family transcriptional regulator, low CO2-responsive transcriptional regulator